MSKIDRVRCYKCREVIPEKDVWWLTLANGGKVAVCATDWSRAKSFRESPSPRTEQ